MAEGHIEFTLSMCVCVCVCLCIPDLCQTNGHNFIVHGGILKLFSTNDHQDKTMCPV